MTPGSRKCQVHLACLGRHIAKKHSLEQGQGRDPRDLHTRGEFLIISQPLKTASHTRPDGPRTIKIRLFCSAFTLPLPRGIRLPRIYLATMAGIEFPLQPRVSFGCLIGFPRDRLEYGMRACVTVLNRCGHVRRGNNSGESVSGVFLFFKYHFT